MRLLKLGVIAAAGFLVFAQAFRIDRSNPAVEAEVVAPSEVKQVMERSCYGCHSNETIWPWYSAFAPVSWLLAHDVREGRGELNFSVWGKYDSDKRKKKLKEIRETLAKGEMPPWYYVYPMHLDARLSEPDRKILAGWTLRQ